MGEGTIRRIWLIATAAIAFAAIASAGWCQTAPAAIWETYAKDAHRGGYNGLSQDMSNPASLNAIWAFPRNVGKNVNEELTIVQDPDSFTGTWSDTPPSNDAWTDETWDPVPAKRSFYVPAISRTDPEAPAASTAVWSVPPALLSANLDLSVVRFHVLVWVASTYDGAVDADGKPLRANTSIAEFTVSDATGDTTYKLDQRIGGEWRLLTTRQFDFSAGGQVTLTNVTDDTVESIASNHTVVAADAVKFVPTVGGEVFASVATGIIYWQASWPATEEDTDGNPDTDNEKFDAGSWPITGIPPDIPAVFACRVEPPIANSASAPDTGVVYCINSVTPTLSAYSDSAADIKSVSTQLGKKIWSYPRKPDADNPNPRLNGTTVSGSPVPANPLEGPIEGGIYASPTLVKIGGRLICFVAAADKQVYALDATTGKLIWKGPGVTLTETLTGTDKGAIDYPEAFGGQYGWAHCDTAAATVAFWDFTADAPKSFATGVPPTCLSYAVYVWIPGRQIGEPYLRAADATYKITYQKNAAGNQGTTTVKIDQSDPDNQGRWMKIASSLYNVSRVELLSTATPAADGLSSSSYLVVADAARIIPESVDDFGYCTPVVNIDPLTDTASTANTLFVANASGRVLAFDLTMGSTDPPFGKLKWIYPKVRTSFASNDGDADSLGQLAGSPAYFHSGLLGKGLVIAGYDGRVHNLMNPETGTLSSPPANKWEGKDPIDDGGFTSSPAIDQSASGVGDKFFIGSTSGNFYAISLSSGNPVWSYPEYDADKHKVGTGLPLGSFKYSTAAVTDVGDLHRVWVGSSDGKIYSFAASDGYTGDSRRLRVEFDDDGDPISGYNVWYIEPSANSPILASVAIAGKDNLNLKNVMIVGDAPEGENAQGVIRWYNAKTGESDWEFDYNDPDGTSATSDPQVYQGWQCEGSLFSSPSISRFKMDGVGAIANEFSYVYNGCTDGRVYALSQNGDAWGGRWAGGSWGFEGRPNSGSQSVVAPSPDTEVQFDMFQPGFFQKCMENAITAASMEQSIVDALPDPASWTDDTAWILTKEMKQQDDPISTDVTVRKKTIDNALRDAGKKSRMGNVVFPNIGARTTATDKNPIYLEWGETVNMIVWNLPEKSQLSGTITFNMANSSAGSSSGSTRQIKGAIKGQYDYVVTTNTLKADSDPPEYEALVYDKSNPTTTQVKRSFVLAQLEIKPNSGNPPSPGPGWVITADVRRKTSSGVIIRETIYIAKLTGSPPAPTFTKNEEGDIYAGSIAMPQLLGVNNPLAIKTTGTLSTGSAGWPNITFDANRISSSAHYNGNGMYDAGEYSLIDLDTLRLGRVAHGTSSPMRRLGVLDRSATGLATLSGNRQQMLERFRVSAGDLRWQALAADPISQSGGLKFPWELGLYSADYPPIYKRFQNYRKLYDAADPSRAAAKLPPLTVPNAAPGVIVGYDECHLRPDILEVNVEVPRFQPANTSGYLRSMQAFIDSNSNGQFDSGNVIVGRQSTYQEAYRQFKVDVEVPPDPRIEVDEQLIDIGQASHGMGEGLYSVLGLDFMGGNPKPEVSQWFKRITVKNAGNVNLHHLSLVDPLGRYGKGMPLIMVRDTRAFATALEGTPFIKGAQVRSSLDSDMPATSWLQALKVDPFVTNTGDDLFGYTLTKPRVGDPDPTILKIPDKRKWDADTDGTQGNARNAYYNALVSSGVSAADATAKADEMQPLPVEVSVSVPVGQPIGTYQASYVPIYARYGPLAITTNATMSAPSFGLKVTVRENQLTGDRSPGSLAQIDTGTLPKFGDATPAAYRDANGNVHLFWSSNRTFAQSLFPPPDTPLDSPLWRDFASAPWFIEAATLNWNASNGTWGFSSDSPPRWWNVLAPQSGSTVPPIFASYQWPTPLLGSNMEGASVLPWTYDGSATSLLSVEHHSPTVGENTDPDVPKTYLAWAGTADVQMPNGKLTQESRIFYLNATGGVVTGGGESGNIPHDPSVEKRYPSMAVYNLPGAAPTAASRMWMFWQGGDAGKWSIYYSVNRESTFPSAGWAEDARLRTPDCLATVSSPNAVHRRFWETRTGSAVSRSGAKDMLDMVYAGTSRVNQTSDIILGRYAAVAPGDEPASAMPSSVAQPMPRVFAERLQRDPKFGFYTSEHLAWIRIDPKRVAAGTSLPDKDRWGDYMWGDLNADLPYIHVYFPGGYQDLDNNIDLPFDSYVSGTDGGVYTADGGVLSLPFPLTLDSAAGEDQFRLQIDQATGIYTYKYPTGSVTQKLLGDMLVDFSAGVVRFTQPLKEVQQSDGTIAAPQVKADYTPLTWRLTTDPAVDNSPRAFIERTPMNSQTNPGRTTNSFADWSVDRMWVFWRRAGTAVESSTVYWKTYRVGVDLAKLAEIEGREFTPIPMDSYGHVDPKAKLTISGNLGPWEVDRAGTRIYFSQVDERYRSLFNSGTNSGSLPFLTANPAPPNAILNSSGVPQPITISYSIGGSGAGTTHTAQAHEVFWLNEMQEQSLFGYVGNASVNEGSVYAFADLFPEQGTVPFSKVWVFWTTTRGGTSDLCWATLSPNFSAR